MDNGQSNASSPSSRKISLLSRTHQGSYHESPPSRIVTALNSPSTSSSFPGHSFESPPSRRPVKDYTRNTSSRQLFDAQDNVLADVDSDWKSIQRSPSSTSSSSSSPSQSETSGLDVIDSSFEIVKPVIVQQSEPITKMDSKHASNSRDSRLLKKHLSDISIKNCLNFSCCARKCCQKLGYESVLKGRQSFWTKNKLGQKEFTAEQMSASIRDLGKFDFQIYNEGFIVKLCRVGWMEYLKMNKTFFYRVLKEVKGGSSNVVPQRRRKVKMTTQAAIAWFSHFCAENGDKMPHLGKDAIRLPPGTKKAELYSSYVGNMGVEDTIAKPTFLKMWRKNFPHVKIKERDNFSRCKRCVMLDRKKRAAKSLEMKMVYYKKKMGHLVRQHRERQAYYRRREAARLRPNHYMSIIIDGMDQSKTSLPHFTGKQSKDFHASAMMKVHVTGVISHGVQSSSTYIDVHEYQHDSNMTMNVLMQVLWKASMGKPLPPVLYIQADNCFRENKNKFLLSFLDLLIYKKIFSEIQLSFLYVGHTHEDIDQLFSRIAHKLSHQEAQTHEDLMLTMPNPSEAKGFLDIKNWLLPYIVDIRNHTKTSIFRFRKNQHTSDKVDLFYKKNSDQKWRSCLPGMFRVDSEGRIRRPEGKPDTISPDYTRKELNIDGLQKQLHIWKQYFDHGPEGREFVLWDRRLKKMKMTSQNRLATEEAPWLLDDIPPFQPASIDEPLEDNVINNLLKEEQANPEMTIMNKHYAGEVVINEDVTNRRGTNGSRVRRGSGGRRGGSNTGNIRGWTRGRRGARQRGASDSRRRGRNSTRDY